MREILFRGKSIEDESDGKWVYGYAYSCLGKWFIQSIEEDMHTQCFASYVYQVASDTVGQFTGLLDRNGKKIFEGDILHQNYHSENDTYVQFLDGAFHFIAAHNRRECDKGYPLALCFVQKAASKLSIIGTVYDNPELVGDKDE